MVNHLDTSDLLAKSNPAYVTPQDVEINAVEDKLNTRTNRLSSPIEKAAYKAFIRVEVNKIRQRIANLRNQGLSSLALNLYIDDFSKDLKASANSYLANCSSYQVMSAAVDSKLENTKKKIEDKKFDFPDFINPENIGTFVGAGVGTLLKDEAAAKVEKVVATRMAKKIEKAIIMETAASDVLIDLQITSFQSDVYMSNAKGQAIKKATKNGVCDMAKVKELLQNDLQIADAIKKDLALAEQAKLGATVAREKIQQKGIQAAGNVTIRKKITNAVLVGGASLAGKLVGNVVSLLLEPSELAGPEHDELPKEPNEYTSR